MAAYAALLSLMNTVDLIQLHPRPPFRLNTTQVETLTENIAFLQEFLEGYSLHAAYSKEADPLEMRIAGAAHAIEDVIESHLVDYVEYLNSSGDEKISFFDFFKWFLGPWIRATDRGKKISFLNNLYRSLQMVIEDMDSLKKEVMEIQEKSGVRLRNSMPAPSLRSSTGRNVTMVGFDDILVELMDKLTGSQHHRQIIPIIGMGGTGKTTLARNIYQHPVVVQHFDFRAWVTISQQYRIKEILLKLLQEVGGGQSQGNAHELGDQLHRILFGRRYLIIVDDIWDIQVLDQLRIFFPDNINGSRIVITTRISNFESTDSYVLKMGFLNEDNSWTLFSKIVFAENGCPIELEEIGKKIIENCRGLPLSIVVVGGLLENSKHEQTYWEYIAENLSSIVNSEDDDSSLKILHMSYNELPLYLKPCFLYMGVFSEDERIRVSELIKLWASEGFLRPISGKTSEEVADEYLQELIDRNLVLVHELGCTGNIKYCKVHDLLRDLCLRQAEKESFYYVLRQHNPKIPEDKSTQRRVIIPECTSGQEVCIALKHSSRVRSLLNDSEEVPPLRNFRLLRILLCSNYDEEDFGEEMLKIVNARCLVFNHSWSSEIPFSSYQWNLQTLVVETDDYERKINIWNMPQLRHLVFAHKIHLEDLPHGNVGGIVLKNLQTLATVWNFKCCAEVVRRIPNIKKLKLHYIHYSGDGISDYCVNNFSYLHKLESLNCSQIATREIDNLKNLAFPHSLKKLTLSMCNAHWEDKLEKVGSLPLLEKLELDHGYFPREWKTVEGQFRSLKCLKLGHCNNLEYWTTDSTHFPRLERLFLEALRELKEIPSEIGEIPTLKSITMFDCSTSLVDSAWRIREEQEELYGEVALQVQVPFDQSYSSFAP